MKYAIIKDNIVENVIEIESEKDNTFNAVCCENLPVGIGTGFVGGKFIQTDIVIDEKTKKKSEVITEYFPTKISKIKEKPILKELTFLERIEVLESENKELKMQVENLVGNFKELNVKGIK